MKFRLIYLFLLSSISLIAQTNSIDSLLNCLNKSSEKEKIPVLNQLGYLYLYKDDQKALNYARDANQLSNQFNFNSEKARSFNIMGIAFYNLGQYGKAIENYNQSIFIGEKHNSKKDVTKALYNLISLYFYHRDLINRESIKSIFEKHWDNEENIDKFNTSVLIYTEIVNDLNADTGIVNYLQETEAKYNDSNKKAILLGGVAYHYYKSQKYFYAIQYYEQALKLSITPSIRKNQLLHISNCFFQVGKYMDAIHFLEEALAINNKNEFDKHFDIYIKTMLAQNYYQLEEYYQVVDYLLPALDKLNDFIIEDRLAIINNLSLAFLRIDSLNKAGKFIEEGDKLIESNWNKNAALAFLNTKAEFYMKKSVSSDLERTIQEIIRLSENELNNSVLYDTFTLLAKYYEKNSDYEKANKYFKRLAVVNDSIQSIENQNAMNEFLVKYETEKKEKQIIIQENEIQKKRKIQLLLIIVATILVISLIFIVFTLISRNRSYKKIVLKNLEKRNYSKSGKQNLLSGNKLDEQLEKKIKLKLDELLIAKVYLDNNLTLKKLAELCRTNQSYLSQVINHFYGQNFNQFINNFRVREALELLSKNEDEVQLKKLYLDLGFNSYSVFNQSFKEIVGVTPGFYQKTVYEELNNETTIKK
ncbi:MAG: AraC family transcriptional regulator [Mariniphaga sp.]|nr:AraC family transcriptional regulator [Mariniphaga sp.]